MCKEFREQKSGECQCGLFVKEEEQPIPRKIDYTGFENEYIKVIGESKEEIQIEKNKSRKNKATYWECFCKKCKGTFHTESQNVPKVKSCGCSRRYKDVEKEIGQKYGHLTILEDDSNVLSKNMQKGNNWAFSINVNVIVRTKQ